MKIKKVKNQKSKKKVKKKLIKKMIKKIIKEKWAQNVQIALNAK